jgi:hypothetical protein
MARPLRRGVVDGIRLANARGRGGAGGYSPLPSTFSAPFSAPRDVDPTMWRGCPRMEGMLERSRPVTAEASVTSTVKIDLQEGLAALLPETDQTIQEAAGEGLILAVRPCSSSFVLLPSPSRAHGSTRSRATVILPVSFMIQERRWSREEGQCHPTSTTADVRCRSQSRQLADEAVLGKAPEDDGEGVSRRGWSVSNLDNSFESEGRTLVIRADIANAWRKERRSPGAPARKTFCFSEVTDVGMARRNNPRSTVDLPATERIDRRVGCSARPQALGYWKS